MRELPARPWSAYPFPRGRRLDGWCSCEVRGAGILLVPTLLVREEGDAYLVVVEIPGAEGAELRVSVEAGTVRIDGERQADESPSAGGGRAPHCLSGFTREIRLEHGVDAGRAEAYFANGVLEIRLPRAAGEEAPVERRSISVEVH